MSDAVSGQNGKILFTGGTIIEIRNWNIARPADALDTTSMSSGGWKENKIGLKGWSGDFEVIKYVDLHGSQALGSFYVGTAAGTTTPVFAGTISITDAGIATPYDNIVAYRHTFQGSGPCTATVS